MSGTEGPGDRSVASYGVNQATAAPVDEFDRVSEELAVRGVSTLEGALGGAEVDEMCDRLDSVYRVQCDEVGGEGALRAIGDDNVVRCPLAYDDLFLGLALNQKLAGVAKAVLGDSVVLMMQNGIINYPATTHVQAKWHRDLNYQHWTSSAPIAINALMCLEDFSAETGGTVCLPASHKSAAFPSDKFIGQYEVTVNAPRGSFIFMDAMTYHRAGINTSNRIRRAVNHVIGVPILAQPVDIPAMLSRDPPSDAWTAGYLGYRWNPVPNVREWRLRRLASVPSS